VAFNYKIYSAPTLTEILDRLPKLSPPTSERYIEWQLNDHCIYYKNFDGTVVKGSMILYMEEGKSWMECAIKGAAKLLKWVSDKGYLTNMGGKDER